MLFPITQRPHSAWSHPTIKNNTTLIYKHTNAHALARTRTASHKCTHIHMVVVFAICIRTRFDVTTKARKIHRHDHTRTPLKHANRMYNTRPAGAPRTHADGAMRCPCKQRTRPTHARALTHTLPGTRASLPLAWLDFKNVRTRVERKRTNFLCAHARRTPAAPTQKWVNSVKPSSLSSPSPLPPRSRGVRARAHAQSLPLPCECLRRWNVCI